MKRKRKKLQSSLSLILIVLMFSLTGCAQGIPPSSTSVEKAENKVPEKVLLAVNQYTEDGLESRTSYEYNEKGLIIRETNSFTYDEKTSVEVYDLSYDSEDRLIKKTRSSGDSGWSSEDLERKDDSSGNMVKESSYKLSWIY